MREHELFVMRRRCILLSLAALLSLFMAAGCSVGPNFKKPEIVVPDRWVAEPAPEAAAPPEMDLARWWNFFDDPTLTSLVERAITGNLDIKLAEARIRQARAARGLVASGMGPVLDATGSYRRSQSSGSPAPGGDDIEGPLTNLYQAGFDASWELDIFGGVRRGIEAANADLRSSVETRRDVLVTLSAEVALTYLDLRSFQQRIAVARQNLKAQEHSARLTRQRFEFGFASGLDVANAEAQAATTAAQIPLLEAAARQTIYGLSVLLGREPGALLKELSPPSFIPAAPPTAPLGVPSDLLRRRPDIRRAEAEIHSATARIGVATADLFPRFFIFGSAGYQARETSAWFDPVSRFWSFGPSVSWPVFDTGRIRSNIEVRKALEEESVLTYRKTVLAALEEVESALIASEKEQERRTALLDAVVYNQKAVELSIKLYTEGQTDFLNVLQAQRSLFTSEDALAQSTSTISTNLVALYKALGGGWDTQVD
jgi:outer membrane protein, multidrug efflux system